jgi:hypothetical protein
MYGFMKGETWSIGMISQPSSHTEPPVVSDRSTLGRYFLRVLLALSLIYYAALVLDVVLHPLAPDSGYAPSAAVRLLITLAGTGVIVVGAFIMRRVPGNLVGPLLMVYGVGVVGWSTRVDWGSPLLTSSMHLLLNFYFTGVALPALIVLLFCFPTGQIYPRWVARWVVLYVMLLVIGSILEVMAQSPGGVIPYPGGDLLMNPVFVSALAPYYTVIGGDNGWIGGETLLFLLGIGGAVVSLILRYRAAHTRERLQMKWFIWVTGVFCVLTIIVFVAIPSNNVVLGSPQLGIALLILYYRLLYIFPAIGIGLGILRSRLWDIDIIINRTLVYGSLTALLALVYFGLIFALQSLFQGMFHQNNAVAIVVSTLVIAGLFQPLRRRMQAIIDRRFYRRKYDTAKTLEAFSATLRNEVDLSQLREHLLTVVQETMQPAHVSLWLREPDSKPPRPDRMQP